MFKRDKSRKLKKINEELIPKNVPDEKHQNQDHEITPQYPSAEGFIEEAFSIGKPASISPCQASQLEKIEVRYSSAIIFLLLIILIILIIFFIVFIWWANSA